MNHDKPKTTTSLTKTSEFATPERARQDGGLEVEPVDRSLKGDVIQVRQKAAVADKMDWYLRRGTIDEGMAQAGKRLMWLMFVAGKVPRTNIMFRELVDRSPTSFDGAIVDESAAKTALKERIDLLSAEEADVLFEVCAYDRFAQAHRIKDMVRGLAVLAESWGF